MPTDSPAVPGAPGRRELILQLLRTAAGPRSIASMADEMAVHPNTIRFHLETLVRAGRVEQLVGDTAGPGRPAVLFRASRRMDPAGPTNYRLLASILTTYLAANADDPVSTAEKLGRGWGPSLVDGRPRRALSKTQAVTALTDVLADLGFGPEPPTGRRSTDIRLRHCPFHELVQTHGDTICALHLGLMQGVLDSVGGPVTVDALDPFVEPDLCVAHLAPVAAAGGNRRRHSGKRRS
jgi:predicted ArsR family transcriptional regulator